MAESLDFQIDGTINGEARSLRFRAAISDKFPYARGTADFRKEQFDSAPTVGDQSLSGWWTRGQLSFHRGAGVKYYEVLDGEEILNRYQDAAGVNTSVPGEATLYNTWQAMSSATVDIACATASSEMVAWTTTSGAVKSAVGPGSVTTHTVPSGTAAGPLAITPQHIFAVTVNSTSGLASRIDKIRHGSAGGASEHYFTNNVTTERAILDIFYEKGRLWFVDTSGAWQVITVSGKSVGTAFTAPGEDLTGATPGGQWQFAGTPGPCYMARDNVVFKATVSDDGAVPALTAPVVVATLPAGDRITGINYYLGHLVITSTSGCRVATINQDGSLTAGPTLFSWPSATAGMTGAALENTIYVYGEKSGQATPSVYAIDLSSEIEPLRYAYTRLPSSLPATTGRGGTLATDGWLYWWSEGGGMVTMRMPPSGDETPYTLTPSGELTTGLHRFGTLEGKHFAGVKLRVGGTGGTVTTYLVETSGVETLLATINVAQEVGAEIALTNNPPSEAIALRFVLSRDATDPTRGPELLGYQIKALPSPVRQRLIKWPLLIMDKVKDRNRVDHGRRGAAWELWQDLEALEEEDALVTYTDHRTGETGQAYIESTELQTETPSQGASTGFGGVGYLTLRRVS